MQASPKRPGSERSMRAKEQAEAKAISDQIDAMLEAERASLEKHNSIVRILLLGMYPSS